MNDFYHKDGAQIYYLINRNIIPANMRRWAIVDLLLAHSVRR